MTDEDFKKFCEQTGRDWRQYANIHLFLEFADWVQEQQKGEKMPTFEPTVKEIIAEMYKRFGHLLGAREIDEFAHDFGRPPAASEERPFGQWTTFEQWWTDAGCKFNDPEIMAVQAFEEGQRQALQTVSARNSVAGMVPSDAGQPRCTICWALLPCKVHQPQPRTCQEEQD